MNRPASFILLKNKDTGSLRIVWVVLHNLGSLNAREDLSDQNTIRDEHIVAMVRDSNL